MRRIVCALALVAAVACFGAAEIDLRIKGQMTKVRSRETPRLVVNSLDEVKAHYADVRDLLPPTPFIMDGLWVVRLDADGPKTFPDRADAEEFFSPNGEYALGVQQLKTPEGRPGAQKESLFGVDGRQYWSHEGQPSVKWVLDSGRVVALRVDGMGDGPRTSSITILDRESGEAVGRARLRRGSLAAQPCAAHGLLLVRDERSLSALDGQGDVVWEVPLRRPAAPVVELRTPLGSDPLGRGICVTALLEPQAVGVAILDPRNGDLARVLLAGMPPHTHQGWAPGGSAAAVTLGGRVGLVDWRNGLALFLQPPGPEVRAPYKQAISASDSPARLAATFQGDQVFDQTGRLIWLNHVATGESRRLVLSSDGMRLGTVLWDWAERGQGPTVSSVVVYDLPADGQAMRGL